MRFILSFFVLITFLSAQSQKLYMPRDIQQAFSKGTRSADGRPGKNYWQNQGRYSINIKATPPSRTIYGTEEITYINNSPDTLRNLLFKLIVNIHKPGAPRLGGASKDYLTTGVHIDSFSINGKSQQWNNSPQYYTNVPVRLRQPLPAHDSVRMFVRWHYDVSLQSNREGMIDSTTYFLAYFYPRVAVYDDYQGWDFTTFNDALEFYNDFNDYILRVEVPSNYLVWATGHLMNPDQVLQKTYAEKYLKSLNSDDVTRIASPDEVSSGKVTTHGPSNTWEFRSNNIPDVALGLSDHFSWDAGSVVVDPSSGRRASVQAAYNDTAADYHHMVGLAKQALSWLSTAWPGIPYPYEKTTIFQGYAGMEYPMMANDETYGDTVFARFVAMHEIAHTYMPFYMGINETRYGFMDEGWATTFELLFNRDKMGMQKADDFYKRFRVTGWINDRSQDEDMPIITPGPSLSGGGIGNNQYGKPSLGYLAIKDMLGDELFRKCLHEYMKRWNGKHPLPWDFFNSFSDAAGKSLDWFWNNWFFSNNYIDMSVQSVKKSNGGVSISVQNTGGMAAPFDVILTYSDGTSEKFHQTPLVWQSGQKQVNIQLSTKKNVQSVKLDGGIFMDATPKNNEWPEKKAF